MRFNLFKKKQAKSRPGKTTEVFLTNVSDLDKLSPAEFDAHWDRIAEQVVAQFAHLQKKK